MEKWNAILRQVQAQRARKLPIDELGAASTYYWTPANPPRSSVLPLSALPVLQILSFLVPPTLFPPLLPELQMLSCP